MYKTQSLSGKDICAIIVSYNPDPEFPKRVNSILMQVNQVVIVDNNSTNRTAIQTLRNLINEPHVHLIINNDNYGVATALNQGIYFAKSLGYLWSLLFDQDTTPGDYLVETLVRAYNALQDKGKAAIIGANRTDDVKRIKNIEKVQISFELEPQKTVITSGSLLSISVFDSIGKFRELFFIDHVDDEYCLRARSKGFTIFRTREPLILHSIGNLSTHWLIYRTTGTTNHSAMRRYYMYRNHTVLIKEYFLKEPVWVLKTFYSRLKSIILLCCYEKHKILKLKAIILGIIDGINGNFKKYDTTTEKNDNFPF